MQKEITWDKILIGDRVRSFDFENNETCFMDGKVISIEYKDGCDRYVISVDFCCFDSEEHYDYPDFIYPPVNGTKQLFSLIGFTHLVKKLGVINV
jgi:hypothetical protein